ncbi:hypothetical protein FNV43_RR07004 [Rhamnella rubrinervis]|uniref:Uncharacterized protein n=1 Tax=Rhamnella rubrinervis TaxID=2594499 RepID=A0A8K0HFM7_9ROSA|nr:hypothetical protein FNV43_RR07004 [Rhamnella rubrinervis]
MELKLELLSSLKQLSRFKGNKIEVAKASGGKNPMTDSRVLISEELPADCSKAKATTGDSSKGKAVLWCSELEQLNKRLKVLEEETKTMKDALFESMEERNNLMNDIYQQFQQLQSCLFPSNLAIEDNFSDRNSSVSTAMDVRVGTSVSEILRPQPNPSFVAGDLGANLLTSKERAEGLHLLSDR